MVLGQRRGGVMDWGRFWEIIDASLPLCSAHEALALITSPDKRNTPHRFLNDSIKTPSF
jgi:hypothetical protein